MTQIPVELDDVILRDLGRAWPRLERLSLGTKARTQSDRLSLNAIRALSIDCPRLKELALTFNSVLTRSPTLSNAGSRHGLEVFDVGCSAITELDQSTEWMVDVFPRAWLCDPYGPHSRALDMDTLNIEVMKMVKTKAV